jgi:hypothetical protein
MTEDPAVFHVIDREFSVGSVLSNSFGVWLANLIPFTLIGLLVYSPLIALQALAVAAAPDPSMARLSAALVQLLSNVASFVLTGALTYGAIQQLRGRRGGFFECVGVGLRRFFPILSVGFLMALCIFGGMFLLVIPGLVVMCMLWVAVPVAVVEKPGVLASLRRSRELTDGYKWPIFWLNVLLIAVNVGATFVLTLYFLAGVDSSKADLWLTLLLLPLSSFWAVTAAVGYHDLRLVKEGVDVAALASVFD